VLGGEYRTEDNGRYTTLTPLAEAETVRCIMHVRLEKSVIDNSDTSIALRCVPSALSILDSSLGSVQPSMHQLNAAHQSSHFLDCDMFYKDAQIDVLVQASQGSSTRERIVSPFRCFGCH